MDNRLIIIMGPSGAGKTTLVSNLKKKYKFAMPRQTTTRLPRSDDAEESITYISLEEFEKLQNNDKFAIYSGKHERRLLQEFS